MKRVTQQEIDYIEKNSHKSLDEILKGIDRPRSTVWRYLIRYRPERKRNIYELNRERVQNGWKKFHSKWENYAKEIFDLNKNDSEFWFGIALYISEGTKKKMSFANTDVALLKGFLYWVRKYIKHDCLVGRVQIPSGESGEESLEYWGNIFPSIEIRSVSENKSTKKKYGVLHLEANGVKANKTFTVALMNFAREYMLEKYKDIK